MAKENRKSQSVFKCVKCGHTENADVNASHII
ncbi:MAG: zinc ribbon domain-containing protein [Oligoflexales bacterium]